MGKQETPNLRGKGISSTKFTKSGAPKHAGNWSVSAIRIQSMQFRDYPVQIKTYDDGSRIVQVGNHTRLCDIIRNKQGRPAIGEMIEQLILDDAFFGEYKQIGTHTLPHGKKYEVWRSVRRHQAHGWWGWDSYVYREAIYTENEFTYHFPEY